MNFQPDWATSPSETIQDILAANSMSVDEFVSAMNSSKKFAQDLIKGHKTIDEELAYILSQTLGASKQFWINRQKQYQEQCESIAEREKEWLSQLPTRDMVNLGWLNLPRDRRGRVQALLDFFNVSSIYEWKNNYNNSIELAAFRNSPSFEPDTASVAAWIRYGEIQAQQVNCALWDSKLFLNKLNEIKKLTRIKSPQNYLPRLREICAECGVAIVVARAPSGCRASGATKFITENKAMLMLSCRYLSDDQFWFTFFHEAAHLLLHSKNAFFIENADRGSSTSDEETEANEFARQLLVPDEKYEDLKTMSIHKRNIIKLAREVGVSPGIVVGQLQNMQRIRYNQLNGYKRRYKQAELV